MKFLLRVMPVFVLVFFTPNFLLEAYDREPGKPTIILAAFGTTELEALSSFRNIEKRVTEAFPGYQVRLAFTSNIIRDIWHKRSLDKKFRKDNPKIEEKFYKIGNVLTELAAVQENGSDVILVQSLHITDGEEYQDLKNLIKALKDIKTFQSSLHPFPWMDLGQPALGVGDGQKEYLERAAGSLASLYSEAKDQGAALVLMAHGNEHINQKVYGKFEKVLRDTFGPSIFIGTVEHAPKVEDVIATLSKLEPKPSKVLLAPLMIVAGDHARNDMAGEEEDSWASLFKAAGYDVSVKLSGLGENDPWVDIYVEHLKKLEKVVLADKNKK
jgi:sirohydrochlorin cobaltochelatase